MVAPANGNTDLVELLVKYKASLDLQSNIMDIWLDCPVDTYTNEELQHIFSPRILDSGAT